MKTIEIREAFGVDNLVLCDRPSPAMGPSQVRVRVRKVSLNFRDYLMVTGGYDPRQALPLVPCSDAVGIVEEVGSEVTRWRVGDRVCTSFFRDWAAGEPTRRGLSSAMGGPVDGTLREEVVLPETALVGTPPYLDDAEASTLTCAAVTAWSALVTQGGVTAGDVVLVQGTGGVSMFALQIAQALGARVIATSSSDAKLKILADEYGIVDTVNYVTHPQWAREAQRLTDRRGVDHVVEVGGAGTLGQSVRAVRPGGTVSLIGVLAGRTEPFDVAPVLMRNVRVQGVIVGSTETFEAMNRAFALHQIRPRVDREFALEEASEAFRYLAEGRHMGKVVIGVSS